MKKEKVVLVYGRKEIFWVELLLNTNYQWEVAIAQENHLGKNVIKSWILENKRQALHRFNILMKQDGEYYESILDCSLNSKVDCTSAKKGGEGQRGKGK